MPTGSKDKYTDEQKRQAEEIAAGYRSRGISEKEAERRAWATVNSLTGGGKKSGSGRGKPLNPASAASAPPAAQRSASARSRGRRGR